MKSKFQALHAEKQFALGSECISKDTQRKSHASQIPLLWDVGVALGIPPLEDKSQNQKLAAKVVDLLKLVSIEQWTTKYRFEVLQKEKISLEHKANAALGMVEEFQTHIRKEDDKFAAFEVNLADLGPQSKGGPICNNVELLKPSSEDLIDQASEHAFSWLGLERCLLKHTSTHKLLLVQLIDKLSELTEVLRKCDFHEFNHRILSLHLLSLRGKMRAKYAYSSPHPIPYSIDLHANNSFAIAVGHCKKCLFAFQIIDIVIASCLHQCHPLCVLLHFTETNTCVKLGCTVLVSPEWYKSFGFRAFGIEMADLKDAHGREDAWIQNLANQRDQVLLHCPNADECIYCLRHARCKFSTLDASVFL